MICIGCKRHMSSDTRTGLCKDCRTVKCSYDGCDKIIVWQLTPQGFCNAHGKYKKKVYGE